jgi:hypothetical protein
MRPPSGRRCYAPSFVAIPRPFSDRYAPPPLLRRSPACGALSRGNPRPEENIVALTVGRYIAGANPPAGLDPVALPSGVATHTPASSASHCRPRRVAAPGDADRMNRAGVFADATPTEEFRDVIVPNAPSLKAISFFPHSTALPAGRFEAALAARLGVLPQCRSACLSMPPTPRKPA